MPRTAATEEKMARIVHLLTRSPSAMTAAELSDLTLIPANHVSALCSQLRTDGAIIRADGGGRRIRALWTVEKKDGEGQKENPGEGESQVKADNDPGEDSGAPRQASE